MAYENTIVAVPKSQDKIRQLILKNGGTGVAFVSEPPMEGFQAKMMIDSQQYTVRISAYLNGKKDAEKETRRIWRVLFHHLKDIFEASNSGVMEFRELILPYIVTADGKTVAEHILPKLESAINGNPARMLPAPREK